MRRLFYFFVSSWILTNAHAQMQQMGETLYGLEWINPDRTYFKIGISTDGLYRVSYQRLRDAGIPVDTIPGASWHLHYLGKELPMFVSSGEQALAPSDFLEFYATKNRGELDQFLFSNPETEQHNPSYSLFSDSAAYFLSWGNELGKRIRWDTLSEQSVLSPHPTSYRTQVTWVESSAACQPPDFGNYALLGTYTAGEGFGSYRALRYDKLLVLDTPELGQLATLYVRLSSWPGENKLRFFLNGLSVLDTLINGPVASWIPLPFIIGSDSLHLSVQSSAFVSIAVLTLDYQTVKTYVLPERAPFYRAADVSTLFGSQQGLLYAISSATRICGTPQNGRFAFSVGQVSLTEALLYIPENEVKEITALKRLRFLDFSSIDTDYLLLTPSCLGEAAQRYFSYRASPEGGGYKPVLLEMELVQDYFAYGIPLHPIGIRNLVHYLQARNNALQGIFILGKGLEYPAFRTLSDTPAWLVPAFGVPASDNLYSMLPDEASPHTPVGRLAATTPEQVYDYLQKVKELEATPGQSLESGWPKQVLHLGGGLQVEEKRAIQSYLETAEKVLEQPPLGLHTTSFFKSTLSGLPPTSGDTIRQLIERGVSLLTFFGHSGSNTFDYSINQPAELKNQGRYPIIVALGCSAGQIFGSYRSLSEDYVLEPSGGALGFIGRSTAGDLFSMGDFLQDFYRSINRPEPEFRVGVWLRDALKAFSLRVSVVERALIQTLVLHGDPLLRLPFRPAPDFVGIPESVRISPLEISGLTDTARVSVRVRNLGRSIIDSLGAVLTVWQQDTLVWEQVRRIPAPTWEQTLSFELPIRQLRGTGRYALHLNLNPFHSIPEWPYPEAEKNNAMVLTMGSDSSVLEVQDQLVTPLHPRAYGVVDTVWGQFIVNTGAVSGRFYVELDTTSRFAAPLWRDTLFSDSVGIRKGGFGIALDSGQTYFWRCVSLDDSSRIFFVRSFTCMPGTTANWLMRHFDQFSDCQLHSLALDTIGQRMVFSGQQFIVHALTGRYPDIARPEIAINHVPSRFFPYNIPRFDAGFYAAVFDRHSGEPWKNEPGGLYGSQLQTEPHPAVQDFYAFPFSTTSRAGRRRFLHFLDTIPPGNQVLLLSVSDQGQSLRANEWGQDSLEWGRTLFGVLEQQGARQIRRLQEAPFLPYLLLFQKDSPTFSCIERLADVDEESAISFSVYGQTSEGILKSPLIGPARQWELLEWELADTTDTQQGFMQVWAVDRGGRERLALDSLSPGRYALQLDSTQYPYLYLQVKVWDNEKYIPPVQAYWALHYQRTPELLVQLPYGIKQSGIPIQEGEPLHVVVDIINTGGSSTDSLDLTGVLFKGDEVVDTVVQRIPVPERSIRLALFFPGQQAGRYRLEVEINKHREVLEADYQDNQVGRTFVVEPDRTAPSVFVEADGRILASGDLVAMQPEMKIWLRDPSFSTLLTDTALLEIFLRRPDYTDFEKLTFGDMLTFYPAQDGGMNEAYAVFYPTWTVEGTYELVVRGRDMSGNRASELHLVFEVLLAPQLRYWDAFPNPFTSQVHFQFFLSGSQVPALFRVHIFSQEGRWIRTLGVAELGAVQLGKNETSGGWDGTDGSGHPVPAGIYLCVPELSDPTTDIRPLMVRVLLVR